jgi:hypothetical protein
LGHLRKCEKVRWVRYMPLYNVRVVAALGGK